MESHNIGFFFLVYYNHKQSFWLFSMCLSCLCLKRDLKKVHVFRKEGINA